MGPDRSTHSQWDDGRALPVAVSGPGHVVTQVSAWVESRLGWQVTAGDDLPPVVALVAPGGDGDRGWSPTLPVIALVGPDDDPMQAAVLAGWCDAVVAWPSGHDDLPGVVGRLVADGPRRVGSRPAVDAVGGPDDGSTADAVARRHRLKPQGPAADTIMVGGACGGVGTSTVAITMAAWHVWAGRGGRALAVVSGPAPVPDAASIAPDVLAGHRGWAGATPVPDVAGLRVVRSAVRMTDLVAAVGVATVVDVGVVEAADEEVDVLVLRRDAAGLAALGDSPCGSVVVADDGPVPRQHIVAAAAGRRLTVAPWSVRVARAHARARVPGSLPGRYTTAIGAVLTDGHDPP